MSLADRIARQIAATGPIRLSDYMALALLDPTEGYYTTRDPLGRAGDFITAPEISQMFGELLGLALAQAWMDQGAPDPFTLAELGPGRGTLMADLWRATAQVSGFHAAAQMVLVEVSPTLRARQSEALPQAAHVGAVTDLPTGQPLFLVANEFFDALPIRQFVRVEDGWRETVIGLRQGHLTRGLTDPLRVPQLAHREDVAPGSVVEFCPALPPIAAEIGQRIAGAGGAALIIDYGDLSPLGDTFQAVAGHPKVDPLAAPGSADLTAHVDFAALAEAARPARASAPVPQGAFLERLGITARAQALARGLTGAALDTHVAAHRRLTHPDEMGHHFKVVGLTPEGAPHLPGLTP